MCGSKLYTGSSWEKEGIPSIKICAPQTPPLEYVHFIH